MGKVSTGVAGKIERFSAYVQQQGLKWTRQRAVICGLFFRAAAESHIDVETLLAKVRDVEPGVGHATVYRTMKLLKEAGLAAEREFGDGRRRYEPGEVAHHDHLICTGCGSIVEFQNDTIERLQDHVAQRHGFTITHHKMELYGLCRRCRSRRKKEAS